MTKLESDRGGVLILAMVIVFVLAGATLTLAQLAFTNTKASQVDTERTRITAALDSGMQAAIEQIRVGTASPCHPASPPPPLKIEDVSASSGAAEPAITVVATCAPTGLVAPVGPVTISVVAYLKQPLPAPEGCGIAGASTSTSPKLEAIVAFSSVAGGTRTARIRSWTLQPAMTCQLAP